MYAEFAFDPKIQSMDETLQRRYVMLLCLTCNGDIVTCNDEEVSCALRLTPEETLKTKDILTSKGLLENGWVIHNWEQRQSGVDKSAERVRKFRERQKASDETLRNVSVTPCNGIDIEVDLDSDLDKEKDTTLVGHSRIRVPYTRIVEVWNRVMVPKGLPEVREITDSRKNWMKREWAKQRENLKTVEDFEAFFQYLATKCTFLFSGTWFCFDWLFKYQNNFTKALEGNYEDGRRKK